MKLTETQLITITKYQNIVKEKERELHALRVLLGEFVQCTAGTEVKKFKIENDELIILDEEKVVKHDNLGII